jgi:chromosome segregation ATPase
LRVERYARDLQNERTATGDAVRERDELRDEIGRRMSDLHALHRDLRHARSEVAVKDAFIADLRTESADLRTESANLQTALGNLRRYANSAGFRTVERVIGMLKRVPFLYQPIQSLVRKAAERSDDVG